MFDMAFDDIAAVLGRTTLAARQLANRARRRVRGSAVMTPDGGAQRRAVDAFMAAVRNADFDALLGLLDPNVVLRSDRGAGVLEVRGADDVGHRALAFAKITARAVRALVNGIDGMVTFRAGGDTMAIMAFTVIADKIVEIFVVADPARLGRFTRVEWFSATP